MDAQTARIRVSQAPVGRLATVTATGRPHIVPCCFALVGDRLFTAVDTKPKSTPALRRLANIAAHSEVSLLVDHYQEDWSGLWWVRVDGTAQVWEADQPGADLGRAEALAALAAKYRQYRESAPPGAVIAVDITRWRWWP